jgi:hypothetical protein
MNYRRLSQGTEWAVLAAVVLLHAMILVPFSSQGDVAWLQIAAEAQPLAAIVLVSAWGVLGPGWRWCRGIAICLLLLFVIGTPSNDGLGPFVPAPVPLTMPFAIAIAAFLFVIFMRLSGLRATRSGKGGHESRPQFSIRSLLVTTTLIAVVIGCLEVLRPTVLVVSPEIESDGLARWQLENQATTVRQCVLSAAVAACSVAALAVVLRPGIAWLRLGILAVAIPTIGAYLTHLSGESAESFAVRAMEMTTALAAPAILVAITVVPLRLMGYRLMRPLCCPATQCGATVPVAQALPRDVNEPIMSDGDHRTTLHRTPLSEISR